MRTTRRRARRFAGRSAPVSWCDETRRPAAASSHRDYVEAAIIAYIHRETLGHLVTAEKLARVTRAALLDLKAPPPATTRPPARGALNADRLLPQYRAHGEEAFALLTAAPPTPALTEAAKEIRQILDAGR